MNKESNISIFIKDMRVNVRIGLLDFERVKPQSLLVSVELFTNPSYLREINQENIIDYAVIHSTIKKWEDREHIDLIETYLHELFDLSFGFKLIESCYISIGKQDIFNDTQQAGVRAFMHRKEWLNL